MEKIKLLILSALLVALVALFAATEVMAQDNCDNVLPNITVTFDSLTPQGDGTWLARYVVSGNKVGEITSVDIALDKDVNVIVSSGLHYADPCVGALADVNWGGEMCEQRILTGTPQVDPQGGFKFEFLTTSRFTGQGGLNVNATRGRSQTCSITVPVESLAGFVSVPSVKIVEIDGIEYCIPINPTTGCPDPGLTSIPRCDGTGSPLNLDSTFVIGSAGDTVSLQFNQGSGADPDCPIANVGHNPCTWVTIGGAAYGPYCY